MPGMTPDQFYESFVWKDFEDWQNEDYSIRRAFHVAVSAFHLADHYCRYYQRRNAAFAQKYKVKKDKGLQDFQKALRRRTRSFKVIQDMANAIKHLYTRTSCSIASGGAIEFLRFGSHTVSEKSSAIIIKHRDGSVTKFAEAIQQVMDMWSEIIDTPIDPLSV